MKKLTRMKLINWHRFTDCTMNIGDFTLLSGENGAGKSTLLDAIQFVITCSANYFNKAAHENGKRKLTGYIRCKTGREQRPYERTGEISAHIALEFYEESRDRYFVVGAAIDSASEGQETTVRYLMDNTRFTEDMFFSGRVPKSISEFRAANKGIKQWCKTQAEAKKMMKSRFGRIEDKFFRLIPKALAFKPIDDIKDFVYSYVLDEKEVNIDVLRENVRSYQDLGRTLDSVRKRLEKLETIEKYHQEVLEGMKRDQMYGYFLAQADLDITKENIAASQSRIQAQKHQLEEIQKQAEAISQEKKEKEDMALTLRLELKEDKDYLALEAEKKQLAQLQDHEKKLLTEMRALRQSVKAATDQIIKLQSLGDDSELLEEYRQALERVDQGGNVAETAQQLQEALDYKKKQAEENQRNISGLQLQIQDKSRQRSELKQKIEQLKRQKLSYPPAVNCVFDTIREDFARLGRDAEPHVLCELLEITDESWRNAVEGYLNTQRFYLLVEPENFDIALGSYDKLRKAGKAYGVGLVNTHKIERYSQAPKGSLATVVTSQNQYAQQFVNLLLGKVQMCQRYDQLKYHKTAITKECMKYQNRVASAIKPSVFEVPFIGKKAFRIQLEQTEKQYRLLDEEIKEEEAHLDVLEQMKKPLELDADLYIIYNLHVITDLKQQETKINNCKANIDTLEKNSTFLQKQMQLKVLEEICLNLQRDMDQKNRRIGTLEEQTREEERRIEGFILSQGRQEEVISGIVEKYGDDLPAWRSEYQKLTSKKSVSKFRENYDRRRKANETTRREAEEKMSAAMFQYKTEHDFGAAPTMEGFREFAEVYDRLRTSELLEYEEKVRNARMAAEEEFREQFLARLQENMKQAQNEFKELNGALKDIHFSNEKYEFLYMPSKRFRSYYEMIMDDFNAMQGESLFSGAFHENHKEVIDELFARLALDNENSAKSLDEFTDYRTYMDYDIRIIHTDGNYSYYSKVCEEKSGGETQTPFYVTVAASFMQLYSNNIGGEAIGLVLFDEAFNNMDDERIGGVLKFLHRLPLQILIAAPPDKIQYIGPEADQTLLVMTDEKVSYMEEYHNEAIRQTYS